MGKLAGAVTVWSSGPVEGRALPDVSSEGESHPRVHDELMLPSARSQDLQHRSTA